MSRAPDDRAPAFTVVIPTLDEASEIAETIARARRALAPDVEVVVVDGGSRDGTTEIASASARTLRSDPCRGAQLRAGAAVASGEVIVLLHADTWLEPGAGAAIRRALARGLDSGCLRLAIRGSERDVRYRWLERGIDWRTRVWRTATGDQAIFASRVAYERAGGVPPIPLFDDVELVRALKRTGRFRPIESRALTSPRRWERRGFVRTALLHWVLRAAHRSGVAPATLHRLYRRSRTR
ncbi:MAG: TIGR04283 family arsenosugar biosynthesis glycosyltransferase [Gemmatimonadetes bacterium]|nr:TIGR04283 family arsenosugar biosynthesis glycosyltransferase [Gemmatimonadota bacterium]